MWIFSNQSMRLRLTMNEIGINCKFFAVVNKKLTERNITAISVSHIVLCFNYSQVVIIKWKSICCGCKCQHHFILWCQISQLSVCTQVVLCLGSAYVHSIVICFLTWTVFFLCTNFKDKKEWSTRLKSLSSTLNIKWSYLSKVLSCMRGSVTRSDKPTELIS